MTKAKMKEYLLNELKEEWELCKAGKDNNYSYLFMLCNDMGITGGLNAPTWAPKI